MENSPDLISWPKKELTMTNKIISSKSIWERKKDF